jgi:hypothetical protein
LLSMVEETPFWIWNEELENLEGDRKREEFK